MSLNILNLEIMRRLCSTREERDKISFVITTWFMRLYISTLSITFWELWFVPEETSLKSKVTKQNVAYGANLDLTLQNNKFEKYSNLL